MPKREIHHGDAIAWLQRLKEQGGAPGHSVVASLPDRSEFPRLSLEEWSEWFTATAALAIACTPPEGVTFFYQRDIKVDGTWLDKSFLIQKGAEREKTPLLFRKVICRAPPGIVTFGKPAYSHLLCFSKGVRLAVEHSTADVILDPGERTWTRGTGRKVCELMCRFILERTTTRALLNPFCGEGQLLAVANELGLDATGIEKSRKRAEKAELQT